MVRFGCWGSKGAVQQGFCAETIMTSIMYLPLAFIVVTTGLHDQEERLT
jgi:hypothetical protein